MRKKIPMPRFFGSGRHLLVALALLAIFSWVIAPAAYAKDYDDGGHPGYDNPTITVISPNGGETWQIGSSQDITWSSTNIPANNRVKVELSRDGGKKWETIFPSTKNDGSEEWEVTGQATDNARIKVSSLSGRPASDTSNADFTITFCIVCPPGPPGTQGDPGPQGEQGPQGV